LSEEKKPFTVSDRRHFTPEGEARRPERDEAPRDEAPVRIVGSGSARPPEPRAGSPRPTAPAAAPAPVVPPAPGEGVDFASFLVSLAAQASMLLGLAAEPGMEPEPPDLPGARSMIAILEMLQDKTEGRRTPDEDRLLENLLYELRMAYVSLSRAGGA
jgi:hypothetical protein